MGLPRSLSALNLISVPPNDKAEFKTVRRSGRSAMHGLIFLELWWRSSTASQQGCTMGKIFILGGLLAGAVLFSGTSAKAWVGCTCVTGNSAAVCVSGPNDCAAMKGACLLPCDYQAPKKAKMHKKKSKPA
jgi:hypothetical protein